MIKFMENDPEQLISNALDRMPCFSA